jgi:hypothetical protein
MTYKASNYVRTKAEMETALDDRRRVYAHGISHVALMALHELQRTFSDYEGTDTGDVIGDNHALWMRLADADRTIREVAESLPDYSEIDGLTVGAMRRLIAQYEGGLL